MAKQLTEETDAAGETPEAALPEAPEAGEAAPETPAKEQAPAEAKAPGAESLPPVVVRRGPGVGALLLGGAVAAAIGAGGALYAVPRLPPQLAGWLQPPAPDTSAFEAALAAQNGKIAALTGAVEALKTPAGDVSGLQSALDGTAATLRGLDDALKALDARVGALESRPLAAEGGEAVAALQGQIEALRGQVAGASTEEIQAQIAAATAQVRSDLAAAQGEAAQIGASAEAAAKRSLQQAAAARVSAAVQAGVALAPALADAEAAGLTVPEALRADIPALPVLQSAFPEAAREALVASRKAAAGAGLGERLGAFLMAQTGARSLSPREGTDPDAVMSRAQAAVDAGDLPRAIQELGGLPQPGQALMSGWISRAQLRLAAGQAVADLAQSVK